MPPLEGTVQDSIVIAAMIKDYFVEKGYTSTVGDVDGALEITICPKWGTDPQNQMLYDTILYVDARIYGDKIQVIYGTHDQELYASDPEVLKKIHQIVDRFDGGKRWEHGNPR